MNVVNFADMRDVKSARKPFPAPSPESAAPLASKAPFGEIGKVPVLTTCQDRALDQIFAGRKRGLQWLLEGAAGTGKSYVLGELIEGWAVHHKIEVVATASTHKALAVLRSRLLALGLGDVECVTIHSLLGIQPVPGAEGTKYARAPNARTRKPEVVVIDEAGMIGRDLMNHISIWLPDSFILFAGDEAQLPPVGEPRSTVFNAKRRSVLKKIVRQDRKNPLLQAAHQIRASQGGALDWSWCRSNNSERAGVFLPGSDAGEWVQRAFTSSEYSTNSNSFRYLCWTNERVAEVNALVRGWIVGETSTPFSAGERVLLRQPLSLDDTPMLTVNDEALIVGIEADETRFAFGARPGFGPWVSRVPSWCVDLIGPSGDVVPAYIPRGEEGRQAYGRVLDRLRAEQRWKERQAALARMTRLQHTYASTIHCAQGSTINTVFLDIKDIRRNERNVLETQQLAYVGATRAKKALVLTNVNI